ncbi:MAG TPA: murein L,D-transpeptidase, partial [Nitrolancea sp.]|nr:murein L,D-transpeptidase [Nitrolancea sp.]
LAVFGYPISEEFQEQNPADGKMYTVQYFERARFEYHPEFKGTPYEVELGLLGRQTMPRR